MVLILIVDQGRGSLHPDDIALLPENEPEKLVQFRFTKAGTKSQDPTIKAIKAEAYSWLRKPDYISNNVYDTHVKTKLRSE
jgi:hypothetical protein